MFDNYDVEDDVVEWYLTLNKKRKGQLGTSDGDIWEPRWLKKPPYLRESSLQENW